MQVDIYIREKSGKRELRMPLIPEEIQFQSGDATVISYDIMGLGTVEIPSGTELGKWIWKSAFPGKYRQNDPLIRGTWYTPEDYDRTLNDWKKNGTELNLLVTGYPINADVYLKEYRSAASGAFGDISYEIAFVEARSIVVTTTQVKQTETTRPSATTSTYTIKSGDTLWSIAKKFYDDGTKWTLIYEANKDIIEKTARDHGKSSSENGHWIYPGITLVIPNIGESSAKTSTGATNTGATNTGATTNGQGNDAPTNPATTAYNAAYTSQRSMGVSAMVNSIKSLATAQVSVRS